MSLRARLVVALLALFAAGMAVYGVASYRAFERSELARLDEQVQAALPIVGRELLWYADGTGRGQTGIGPHGRHGGHGGAAMAPHVIVAPGTYAELRAPDGTTLEAIQAVDATVQPDLAAIDTNPRPPGATATAPSIDAEVSWRVGAETLDDGRTVLLAMPMTAVEQALDRLLAIELVAGGALLLALGVGAWLVLRSGLRPLEQMAATASSITAGSLEQRVPTPAADTEVRQLATALNRMLDDLEAAFREREATEARLRRFLSDASHELRTPLTSIQGYAELFRLRGDIDGDGDADQADLDVIMRRIEDESGRMGELVENLLALARLDEAAGEPVRDPVDLSVLAADACGDAAAVAPDRSIELDAPAPVPVRGDPNHLRQAIGNLVANALRHTPPGSPVEVAARTVDGHAEVVVRDHGDGLDAEALERVFERFWQADPSRVGVGAGLGLPIVQAVATEHGGRATAGNAQGGGAAFTLRLPADPQRHLDDRPGSGAEPEAPATPAATQSGSDRTGRRSAPNAAAGGPRVGHGS